MAHHGRHIGRPSRTGWPDEWNEVNEKCPQPGDQFDRGIEFHWVAPRRPGRYQNGSIGITRLEAETALADCLENAGFATM